MTEQIIKNTAWGDNKDSPSRHTMSATAVTGTWLFLVAATILSWWLASGSTVTDLGDHSGERTAIIALAMIKMYLVIAVFMGLRGGPGSWHITMGVWLLGTGSLLLFFVLP